MIPADVSLDDFTAAWVDDTRAIGILRLARQVAQHVETCIVQRDGWVVRRPVLRHDGILETSSFEGFVPVLDSHFQVFHPLLGCRRVNIEHNRFLRFHQPTGLVGLGVFGLQSEARHDGVVLWCFVVQEACYLVIEETYAVVKESCLHRLLG